MVRSPCPCDSQAQPLESVISESKEINSQRLRAKPPKYGTGAGKLTFVWEISVLPIGVLKRLGQGKHFHCPITSPDLKCAYGNRIRSRAG